ncbi:hypothetical protein [Mangrovimonas cancribranchiae]
MKKLLLLFVVLFATTAQAQHSDEELAKKLANPVASLISLPFQNNIDFGIGDNNGTRYTLNIQPVLPISINEKWNLIGRVVLPVISQYNITGQGTNESGLSDAVVSGFFSPKASKNGLTWGVGPALLFPTGTDDFLTTKKFGAGPTAVILKQAKGITFGALVNQIWSFAGNEDRADVNQMFLQPFFTYNWSSGGGVGFNMEWTQNWEADTSTVWLNPTFSGLSSFGKQKISFAVGPRFNLNAPDGQDADLGFRAVLILLFPK